MNAPDVATQAARPDDGALRAELEIGLRAHVGTEIAVADFRRRPSPYGTSLSLEEVDVTLADARTLALVFKSLHPDSLLPAAQQVRPQFLYAPRREIDVYRALLPGRALGTATCVHSVLDEMRGRYWLFLERVGPTRLCDVGDFSVWEAAARWLARLHTAYAEVELADRAPSLLRADPTTFGMWRDRAVAFVLANPQAKDAHQAFARMAERYHVIISRLAAMPRAFIHGEFYAANVLVAEESSDLVRICPVDWELAAIGPGGIDLAALTAGRWSDEQRRAMIAAYGDALAAAATLGTVPSADELIEAVDCCRLHLCMQWLGWAPQWRVPPEHAQDWLGQALTLGARLGL